MQERLNRYLLIVTRWCAWTGMAFLLGAMAITAADIALRKIDGQGIFGAVDLVQLMIMGAAYLSIPHGFMTRSHVSVSVVVDHFSRRGAALSNVLAAVLATGFMFAIAWFGYEQAAMQAEYGDVSLTLGLPKTYYWTPLLVGSSLSALVCVHLALQAAFEAVSGRSALTPSAAEVARPSPSHDGEGEP